MCQFFLFCMIFDYLKPVKFTEMKIAEINEWYNRVCELLKQRRLIDALDKISSVISDKDITDYAEQLDNIRFTYSNMLSYKVKGVEDPSQSQIYNQTLVSAYELTDLVKAGLLMQPGFRLAALKHDLELQMRRDKEDMADSLLGLSFDNELNDMLLNTVLFDDESESAQAVKHRQVILRVFHQLWLTDKFSQNDAEIVSRLFGSSSLPWYEKAMMISALTLGLIRCFDVRKVEILLSLYRMDDPQLSQRALVGVLLVMSLYENRLKLYPGLQAGLQSLSFEEGWANDAVGIIIQLIRAKDTDRITRKFREEIIPDIVKFNQDLSEKLNLDKLLLADEESDKNPEWEKYFDSQPDLTRKLEELTNMQMEGADVFLSAFSMLKSFDFFNDIHHWFMPFYPQHYAIVNALRKEDAAFGNVLIRGVENSPYMCNSDKFSFVLNIANLPVAQKEMMAQMFGAEIEQFEELMGEELSDPQLRKKRIIIQYIQDLYRFFKLHRLRYETGDIFQLPLDVHNTVVFQEVVTDSVSYKLIADFYFDNSHFEEALAVYHHLASQGESSAELFEKSGYCLQQLGSYDEAISMYRRADLFDTNRKWLLGKIAQCYLKKSDSNEALNAYLELSMLEPDNLRTKAAIGTCYLNMEQFDKALEYFYAIDFDEPGSAKAMRPVAWCLFALGRVEDAQSYYNQLLEMEPNAYDFMNAGHVALCLNQRQQAVEYYKESVQLRNGNLSAFLRGFVADRKLLLTNGVNPSELPLMLDYLRVILKAEA